MDRKGEIIAGLIEIRKQIVDTVSGLSAEQQDEVFVGSWSCKDLLAHLAGWDYTNIDAVKDVRAGKTPRVFEHWEPNWVSYNAELIRKYKRDDFTELLAVIKESHQALIEYIRKIPSIDIERDFGIRSPDGTNITAEWFLQFEIEDEGRHYDQIIEWLKGREKVST
jgi:hypothetical protein